LIPKGKIGFIPNALDFVGINSDSRTKRNKFNINSLRNLGLEVGTLNLQDYFEKHDELKLKLQELSAIFISSGNVFVLRPAMKLSGLDQILNELRNTIFPLRRL